jgi:hypothetical protein
VTTTKSNKTPEVGDGIGLAEALLGLPGFRVLALAETPAEVVIEIETTADRVGCAGCGVRAEAQDPMVVEIRDVLTFGRPAHTRRIRSKILDRANRAARDGNAVIVAAFGTTDGLGWAMVKLTADEYRELVEAAPPDEGPVCFRVRVDGGLSPWLWTTGRQLRSSSRPSAGRLASEVKRA